MVTRTLSKFTQLSNGNKIPRIGFGTSENQEDAVREALSVGYRHIDTASKYGTEEGIGKILKEALTSGTVKREDLFITTKIWNTEKHDVEGALKKSLERLQLDYVDLYIIHWPFGEADDKTGKVTKQIPLHVTWKALEEQVRAGRVRSIGVSNFNVQLLLDLLSYAEIKPVCNQFEVHPSFIQEDLIGFCKKNDIEVVAYSPLGQAQSHVYLENSVIQGLATKYNKTPGQIILNWHLSRGYSVIPKSATPSRIKENFEADSFELTQEEVKKISALNKNARIIDPKIFDNFGYIPLFA